VGGVLQEDGYIVDFGLIKSAARAVCRRLNQRTLLPAKSDALHVSTSDSKPPQVVVSCEDGSRFEFPAADCVLLPLVHTTAEELALFLWSEICAEGLDEATRQRGSVEWLEVGVSERPGQKARFRDSISNARQEPRARRLQPKPCLAPRAASEPSGVTGETPGIADVEAAFRVLLQSLGPEESSRPELAKTPLRAAKAWRELNASCFAGHPLEVVGSALFEVDAPGDVVCVRDMPFHSLCEHHLLPFWGTAHVAYLPSGHVLGLSKFPRLLQAVARRPQMQERLGHQYAEFLFEVLQPRALLVVLDGSHACMSFRGVQVPAKTRTIVFKGETTERDVLFASVSGSADRARL
jgi:GTP cyclohydrolase I